LLLAVLCILGISSLWVALEVSKNGFQVLTDFVNYQIDLFKNPVAGHGQPWFYHPLVLLLGCFPASIFAIFGFITKTQVPQENQLKKWMVILFWVVLVLFSLVTTKIVHYSSMCWIPIAFMAAYAADKMMINNNSLPKFGVFLFAIIGTVVSILLFAIPLIDYYKQWLIPYLKDPFAVASLSESANWDGFEWVIGIFLLIVIIYSAIQFWRNKLTKGLYPLVVTNMLIIPLYLVWVVPKVEVYTQGPAIAFYQSLSGKDCYVESLGHKSYAQYFYTNTQPKTNINYTNIAWLLEGEIDKPVYFVVKIHHLKNYKLYHLKVVSQKGGFVLLLREPALAK